MRRRGLVLCLRLVSAVGLGAILWAATGGLLIVVHELAKRSL